MCNITRFRQPLSQLNISKKGFGVLLKSEWCAVPHIESYWISFNFFFSFFYSVIHFSTACSVLTSPTILREQLAIETNKHSMSIYHLSSLVLFFSPSWCSFLSFSFLKIEEKRNTLLIKTSNYIYIFIHIYIYSFSLYFFLYFRIPEVDFLTHIVACTLHMQISN